MEKGYSNYDLVDRMISNERKARSWTIFWITLLCILSGVLIWAIIDRSEQKAELARQVDIYERQKDTLANRDALIKSLQDQFDTSLKRMAESYKKEVAQTISAITNIESNQAPAVQQEKKEEINMSLRKLDEKLVAIRKDYQKEKLRLFIHYNYAGDQDQVNTLVNIFKDKSSYLVLPPELVRSKYSTVIKCFNYEDAKQEGWMKKVLSGSLNLNAEDINITHETRKDMSPTIEIWIGSPKFVAPMKANIPVQQKL